MSYTCDPFWQQRIADTFHCALNAYTRVLALRVDLRLPDTPSASDAAVISRFTDSLKARIAALQARQRREGKRVWPTTLRFVWAREFGEIKGKKHYHVVLLLNRDTWCGPGDYQDPGSLAGMIKQAWCSALKVDAQAHAVLARFPASPVSWLTRGDEVQLQQALLQASYLAKLETKATRDGERNFGCSRG
ncbi:MULTISPECIES: inovirus Gp2 family protein [Enterobacter]|uniref:inovirus Gp2 family protein n=1 Tax=Enterobacter TaxID=547 RepID=UPI001E41608C|nr:MULTISPECIES: inovirus Gp2 family protein [Enterobacter]MCE1613515.1 inovirus Gp2 family protein [Enterobacter ludwigii]MCE1626816.1 inovirus Gp2 family protein [Enterobacter ludwigii]